MNKKKKDLIEIIVSDDYIYIVYHKQCLQIKRVSDRDLAIKKVKVDSSASNVKYLNVQHNQGGPLKILEAKVVDVGTHIGRGDFALHMDLPDILFGHRIGKGIHGIRNKNIDRSIAKTTHKFNKKRTSKKV